MGVIALTHIGICVSDPDRSAHFYRDVLGFRPVSRLAIEGHPTSQLLGLDAIEMNCLFLERDGVRLELMHQPVPGCIGDGEAAPMNRRGLTHIALRVEDFDATLAEIEAAGGHLIEASRVDIPAGRAKAAFVLDPDGVRIEIVEGASDPFAPIGEPIGAGD